MVLVTTNRPVKSVCGSAKEYIINQMLMQGHQSSSVANWRGSTQQGVEQLHGTWHLALFMHRDGRGASSTTTEA